MLTTNQKGAVAEAAIAHAAIELGIGVAKPFADERYDLIFDLRPTLVRVQCKWACVYRDVVTVRCYSARRNADGLLRRFYGSDEIDAFAAYCPDVQRCYYLPVASFPGRRQIVLRLSPTQNKQARGVNWASEYEFAATLGARLGP
ncbi:MAG: group I intron-associated PD-(D/E)XK endonuclease [Actinomycetota bacterium]|nr:group I intron-associated PD-(D/E)XK endonuclease [Actinomycetota bacterium]